MMMKRFLRRTNNPIHLIVGLVLLGVGTDLLFHDHYFMWPPGADAYINSDFVGAWGIFAGAGLIYVASQKNFPIKANFVWITLSSAFWGFEVFMEFMHSLIFMTLVGCWLCFSKVEGIFFLHF